MVHSARPFGFPTRPNPASAWLKRHQAALSPATPPPQASAPAATPPSLLPLAEEQLDLALLLSCLPSRQQVWLANRIPPLAAQWPSSHRKERWSASLPLASLYQGRLMWLRARLFNELAGGIFILGTPLWQMSRAARNRALVAHAEALGQVMEALSRQAGAEPPEREFERVLARLRR